GAQDWIGVVCREVPQTPHPGAATHIVLVMAHRFTLSHARCQREYAVRAFEVNIEALPAMPDGSPMAAADDTTRRSGVCDYAAGRRGQHHRVQRWYHLPYHRPVPHVGSRNGSTNSWRSWSAQVGMARRASINELSRYCL